MSALIAFFLFVLLSCGGVTLSLVPGAGSSGDSSTALPDRVIFDFSEARQAGEWATVDDVVMGGVSSSTWALGDAQTVRFSGTVSLENNGGFASVRTRPLLEDLSGYDGIALRVRGDGQRYALNLRHEDSAWQYRYPFDTVADEWVIVRLPFSTGTATSFGFEIPDAPPFDPSRLRQIGLIISDKQDGPFWLEIDWIAAYHEGA